MIGSGVGRARLAVVRRRYSRFGGAERFIERSLTELRALDVEPTLVCQEWLFDDTDRPDWEVVKLSTRAAMTRAGRELAFELAVRDFLRNRSFELVQSHERIPGLAIFRAGDGVHREWLRQRERIQGPLARGWARISPYHRFCLERERQLYEHPDLRVVICNSEMVRTEIAEYFPMARNKTRVIRNGVDIDRFAPASLETRLASRASLGLPVRGSVVAFVGSGYQRKGVATVLAVAAEVPGAHFLIVGHDKDLRRYKEQASQKGLTGRVHFLGGTTNVGQCLDAADVFIFPTLYDPGPNAVLEAMAKGLPVLTSTKCGLAEVLVPTGAGIAHDALDASALSASLIAMLDPSTCLAMGQAARACASELTLSRLAGNLRTLYQELLA